MSRDRGEGRPVSRRNFLRLGLGVLGVTVASFASEPKKVAMAQEGAMGLKPVETKKVERKLGDWEIQEAAKAARIKKFIVDADALVKRYGHANY